MTPPPHPHARSILLLSGPNLNLLGEREPLIYGPETLDDHVTRAAARAAEHDVELRHVQSNHEGDLIDAVHIARTRDDAIIVNAAAVSHYGWGLHDALAAFEGTVVELHISNPFRREPWRHTSVVSPVADVVISGAGGLGYTLAVDAAIGLLSRRPS